MRVVANSALGSHSVSFTEAFILRQLCADAAAKCRSGHVTTTPKNGETVVDDLIATLGSACHYESRSLQVLLERQPKTASYACVERVVFCQEVLSLKRFAHIHLSSVVVVCRLNCCRLVSLLRLERDALLGENERLTFQLQCLTHAEIDQRVDQRNGAKDGLKCEEKNLKCCVECADAVTPLSISSQYDFSRPPVTSSQTTSQECCYELSQHLIDRRVDALERKYGGIGARESATTIQRAFRAYRLQKRFQSIAIQALRQSEDTTTARRQLSSDTTSTRSDDSCSANAFIPESLLTTTPTTQTVSECQRKRSYRVGLNLFNKQPSERGVQFLLSNGFIESVANAEQQSLLVARFLLTRKGVSKAMIGEFLSCVPNAAVLTAFSREIDLSGLLVDVALRKYQTFFRFPGIPAHGSDSPILTLSPPITGEAQKIERMVDSFATRFKECNSHDSLSRDFSDTLGERCPRRARSRVLALNANTTLSSEDMSLLRLERDALLGENERLTFQLQCLTHAEIDQRVDQRNGAKDGLKGEEKNLNSQYDFSRPPVTSSQTTSQECCYELSQHLIDRRVDALERKYGGIRARESATTIQRAFRAYRLQKRFQSIAIQALRQSEDTTTARRQLSSDTTSTRSDDSCSANAFIPESLLTTTPTTQTVSECQRKRSYRVGLNLFNKQPSERGVQFLLSNGFIESVANSEQQSLLVARFLLTRKGVSKAMIGEFLSCVPNAAVLTAFSREIDLSGLLVDVALRKYQTFFRFPGEAQKIERMVDSFATRFKECNSHDSLSRDSVFILSFGECCDVTPSLSHVTLFTAIIMLNTDLHAPTNARNRMTSQQWLQNLKNVFSDVTPSQQFLLEIYQRIKAQELRTGADHVTQVAKVQSAVIPPSRGVSIPPLCVEWRRLVCYCRLYEIRDQNKKESRDRHQREVFLFNDLLLVTKLSSRAKSVQMPEYVFRETFSLEAMSVSLFSSPFHRFGISLERRLDAQRPLVLFNARNELDQKRFCDDLRESILEAREMETIRIHKSNSLLTLENATQQSNSSGQQPIRRKSSSGSLDSGLSLPSRDHSPQTQAQKQNSD
ncbi:unnamed protein product [Medioppia subpectinata]|uniref:SEC7 domain-containing protein n=1 Tax=Medioppia subpectinata TaxID=1979941 RepID=A0A7R9PWG8_9ACAR|nr:unnamed protein product [Medioppia subpectinata]CAG2103923.1 unnamed protein product [Medioppia subpectinata]